MEIADMILVNKADGDLRPQAMRTCADYAGALRLLRKRPQDPEGFPKALTVSAAEGTGLLDAWAEMQTLTEWRKENGHFDTRRTEQARHWFTEEVRLQLLARITGDTALADRMHSAEQAVARGEISPARAAAMVLSGSS